MYWNEIEELGRQKYNLSNDWELCAADASDIQVIQIEFGKKGPRGGWRKGKENKFKGFVLNKSVEV